MDSVRGREWRGREGFVPCVWILGESDEEKKKGDLWRERGYTQVW